MTGLFWIFVFGVINIAVLAPVESVVYLMWKKMQFLRNRQLFWLKLLYFSVMITACLGILLNDKNN